jgi:hypothetical protein
MSITRKHGGYAVSMGATLIGGITRQNLALGSEIRGEATSGEVWARFQALYAQAAAPSFTTLQVAAALAVCGAAGTDITNLSGGLALYAQKHLHGGTRTTGANHRKYAMAAGILYPTQLTAEHRGDAELSYAAVITSNGVNDPLIITDGVSLPTISADAARYTLGPITVGGIALSQKMRLSINFGIGVRGEASDSEIHDTLASIATITPVISITGSDIEWLKSSGGVPIAGLAGTHANTTIFLRKRAAGGTFVGDNTAEHLKMTAAGTIHVTEPMGGGMAGAETTVSIPCYYDGTNAPLTIVGLSAIT